MSHIQESHPTTGRPRAAARARDRAAPAMEAVAAARRRLAAGRRSSRGLRLPGGRSGRRPDRPEAVAAVRARQGLTRDLQLHVPARPRRRAARPASGQTALLKLAEGPCPSCVALSISSTAPQSTRLPSSTLASSRRLRSRESSPSREERGWRRLRLLSSAGNTYNRDYFAETAEGAQRPMLNVFHRDAE